MPYWLGMLNQNVANSDQQESTKIVVENIKNDQPKIVETVPVRCPHYRQ